MRAPSPRLLFLAGCAAGLLAALPGAWLLYGRGVAAGRAETQRRALAKDEALPARALAAATAPQRDLPSDSGQEEASRAGLWCYGPEEAVRVSWPMELVPPGDGPGEDRTRLRSRQGASRFLDAGRAMAEFTLRVYQPCEITAYARVRYRDECSNSFRFSVDGGPWIHFGDAEIYDEWIWERVFKRFALSPGIHRVAVGQLEDGAELDRLVLTDKPLLERLPDETLDALPRTPPPLFHQLGAVSEEQPALRFVSGGVMACRSLVLGAGHTNSVHVFLRLNRPEAAEGTIRLYAARESVEILRPFRLEPMARSLLLEIPFALPPARRYLDPVDVEILADGELVERRRLDFIHPLSWAFLGPFETHSSNDTLPPEEQLGLLPSLPAFEGAAWRVVEDGSCYNELGVIDLNRLYGAPYLAHDRHFSSFGQSVQVAYAVTVLPSFPHPHNSIAYAGDDSLRVWLNARPLLQTFGNAPLETSRQVVGTPLRLGRNAFVFKVPQTDGYWELLFEPDISRPYGRIDFLWGLPVSAWPHPGT